MVKEAIGAAIDPNTQFRAPVVWLLCALFAAVTFVATSTLKGSDVYHQVTKAISDVEARVERVSENVSRNRDEIESVRRDSAQYRGSVDGQIAALRDSANDRSVAIGRIDERLKVLSGHMERQSNLLERLLGARPPSQADADK